MKGESKYVSNIRKWGESMTIRIRKQKTGSDLLHNIEKMADSELNACYQCLKCNAGCPIASDTQTTPAEIVRRLQLGAGNELLNSDLIWLCLSCGTCHARCPMK